MPGCKGSVVGPQWCTSATEESSASMVPVCAVPTPNEQRGTLVLAAFYGFTAREISQTEAIPLGTAKSRVRSGLAKVRSLLGQDETRSEPKFPRSHPTTQPYVFPNTRNQ